MDVSPLSDVMFCKYSFPVGIWTFPEKEHGGNLPKT